MKLSLKQLEEKAQRTDILSTEEADHYVGIHATQLLTLTKALRMAVEALKLSHQKVQKQCVRFDQCPCARNELEKALTDLGAEIDFGDGCL